MAAKHLGFISHFLGPDAPLDPKYVACNSLIMTCSGFVLFSVDLDNSELPIGDVHM